MDETERIDLSPLGLDDLRRARMARAVMARAQLGVVRTPLAVLAGWARPTLAAAAVIAAVSVGALTLTRGPAQAASPLTVADALRIPEPAADIIAEERPVSDDDLLTSWEPRP